MIVRDEAAARLLYTTMHERGMRPAPVDLFKAKVLGSIDEEDRGERQIVWETVEAKLGHDNMGKVFQAIAVIAEKRMPVEPAEAILTRSFDLGTSIGSVRFVDERLKPLGLRLAEIAHAALREQAVPGPVYRRFQYLGWVNRHISWSIPLLHWFDRHDMADARTLEFVSRLEALAWCQMIRAEDVHRRDSRYLALIDAIDQDRALDRGGALDVTEKERNEMRMALSAPNFTKRPYPQFLLLRHNAILEGGERVTTLPIATIEHIYPQKPGVRSSWVTKFGGGRTATRLRHLLGNLTLLTEAEQNAAKNHEFDRKVAVYGDSVFAMSKALAIQADWHPEDVERRTLSMISDLMTDLGLEASASGDPGSLIS